MRLRLSYQRLVFLSFDRGFLVLCHLVQDAEDDLAFGGLCADQETVESFYEESRHGGR